MSPTKQSFFVIIFMEYLDLSVTCLMDETNFIDELLVFFLTPYSNK